MNCLTNETDQVFFVQAQSTGTLTRLHKTIWSQAKEILRLGTCIKNMEAGENSPLP